MKKAYRRSRLRIIIPAALLLIFAYLFVQITLMAVLSGRSKAVSRLEAEAQRLLIQIEQAELAVNQQHDLDAIRRRAGEMGMRPPDEGQIRVIQLPDLQRDTPAEE